ncbi:MAG: hypothetical protein A2913_00805 [Parcubacteria group bacterium RIFCSPLOWO2_01_FULL_40_65]|nr:MAG: hypothetical protein A2734_02525 [Parcubacteria group bacterium RIFCSPHIGHO2_01_FULL_40_30]OHB19422.1 MAG: hypothetical protein A3D40_00645 [Parcubacteria group bacterium RIFCSPHIGHO2_02_FULL_40_12]OHB21120.1 MAG: hypothetical protein A2913_00805 [Parcubacteria group bacterium RIFCSPLOWO2_01_FULL_40_65]OHB23450.1 MAG: hypothetical protein A3I22_01460 [Parcubacteria group bacterium RIFCSPLOWO2_02_FULL_40_12]OHB23915.1 MAG: hypothetical protein A3F96_01675 [Parcubacteria group bacterium R
MLKFFQIAQIVIPPPPVAGRGLTLAELGSLIAIVGSFLTNVAVIGAIIAIIISGVMYMRAGSDTTKITSAKTWLWNSLIGALIVLGVGVIINTIANVVTREFFCRLSILGQCIF